MRGRNADNSWRVSFLVTTFEHPSEQPGLVKRTAGRRSRLLALATALSIGVAACGAGSETATPDTAAPATAAPASDGGADTPASDSLFPNVQVQNITDGSMLNLQEELQGGDLPVLLWFWAPH